MAWGVFFLVVFIGYAGYYALNVLFDLLRGGTRKTAVGGGVHYSLPDLAHDEEAPYEVTDEADHGPEQDGQEEAYDAIEEGYEEEEEEPYEEEAGSALKVEGQGLPLDEFLREAKAYAGSIFRD